MTEQQLRYYKSIIHPLFSIAIPLSFLITLNDLLRLLLIYQLIRPYPININIVLLIVGLSQVTVTNIQKNYRTSNFLTRIREIILILLAATLLLMLSRGYLFSGDFNPLKLDILYSLILISVMWLCTFSIHKKLLCRELLLSFIKNKKGKELINKIRFYSPEASDSLNSLQQIKRFVLRFQGIITFLFLLGILADMNVHNRSIVLFITHSLLGLIFITLLNNYIEEQDYFGAGVLLPSQFRIRKLWLASIFTIIMASISWLVISLIKPFPDTYIREFFIWLSDLTYLNNTAIDLQTKSQLSYFNQPTTTVNTIPLDTISNYSDQSSIIALLFKVFVYGILISLSIGLVVFLLKPLISFEFIKSLKGITLKASIRVFFKFIKLTWEILFYNFHQASVLTKNFPAVLKSSIHKTAYTKVSSKRILKNNTSVSHYYY